MGQPNSAKASFQDWQESILPTALKKADERMKDLSLGDDERRYKSAEILDKARAKGEAILKVVGLSDLETDAVRNASTVLEIQSALKLMATPKKAGAEATLARCTQVLAENPFMNLLVLQDCYLERGHYWAARGDNQKMKAISLLQQGVELYKAWIKANPTYVPYGDASEAKKVSQPWPTPAANAAAKDKYARTLFHLAQMFAELEDATMGAYYCGETLALQLEMDVQNHLEWSENCEQVALFHLDRPDLATSQHLLTCAELRAKQAKGVSPTLIKERLVSLDLTWAKWYIRQLGESLEEKRRPGSYRPPRKELPESLRYPELHPPKERTLLWDGGLAMDAEEAKDIFNGCIRRLRNALEHYDLQWHPVMHCNVVLELSEAYRLLAEFETETHKKCVLHKTRAKRIEPLLQHAIHKLRHQELSRALCLEIGNAYREITELKFEEGRPFEKVAAAAKEAIPLYDGYIDSFRVNGQLPKRLKKEEANLNKQYIHTVFYLARVTSRLDPPVTSGIAGPTQNLRKAVDLYRYCARFIKDNDMKGESQLAERCLEMATLIQENSEMIRVTKARQMRQ